jgi:hypothetical protein
MNLSEFLATYGTASVSDADRRRFDALYASFQRMVRKMAKTHDTGCFGMGCDQLDGFPEYDAWIQGTGLPVLGTGLFRIAFDLGDGRVLKLEQGMGDHTKDDDEEFWNWNGKPSGSSLAEAKRWERATARQRQHLVPVLGYDPKGRWVVMQKVKGLMHGVSEDRLQEWSAHDRAMRKQIPDAVQRVAAQLQIAPQEVRPPNLDTSFRLLDYGT